MPNVFKLFAISSFLLVAALPATEIGFDRIVVLDPTRGDALGGSGPRAIEIVIWYPAARLAQIRPETPTSTAALLEVGPTTTASPSTGLFQQPAGDGEDATYGELLSLDEDGDGASARARERFDRRCQRRWPEDFERCEGLWNRSLDARFQARPAEGPFGLVVFTGGTALSNHRLAEMLASRGWVVATVLDRGRWQRGHSGGIPTPESIRVQAEDLVAASLELGERAFIDRTRLVWAGYSTTSLASLLAQSRNGLASALVSIEGHEGYPGGARLSELPEWDPLRVQVPLLYLRADPGRFERDESLLDDLVVADTRILDLPRLGHHDLRSEIALVASAEIAEGWDLAAEAIALFAAEPEAIDTLELPEWTSLEHRPALRSVSSLAEIQAKAEAGLGAEVAAILIALETRNALPDESVLNRLGYALSRAGATESALEVFATIARLMPESVNAWDSLADAHEALGQRGRAIAALNHGLLVAAADFEIDAARRQRWLQHLEGRLLALDAPVAAADDPVAVVEAFAAALVAGNRAGLLATLGPELTMLSGEAREVESWQAHAAFSNPEAVREWASMMIEEAGDHRIEQRLLSSHRRGAAAIVLTRESGGNRFREFDEERVLYQLAEDNGHWRIVGIIALDAKNPPELVDVAQP